MYKNSCIVNFRFGYSIHIKTSIDEKYIPIKSSSNKIMNK